MILQAVDAVVVAFFQNGSIAKSLRIGLINDQHQSHIEISIFLHQEKRPGWLVAVQCPFLHQLNKQLPIRLFLLSLLLSHTLAQIGLPGISSAFYLKRRQSAQFCPCFIIVELEKGRKEAEEVKENKTATKAR